MTSGANWRIWSVDFRDKTASVIEDIDWNAGAPYSLPLGDDNILLLAEGDFSATTVYRHGQDGGRALVELFEVPGWSFRLFDLR